MTVYVDSIKTYPSGEWCHMIADTRDEMDAMAQRLGLSRGWLHISASGIPHYDLRPHKRDLAVQYGAVEITSKELVIKGRRLAVKKPRRD